MNTVESEIPEKKPRPKRFSWVRVLKYSLIGIFLIINTYVLLQLWYKIEFTKIPDSVTLDFQNKSGAARIRSSFVDVLISSEGAVKKGDGYTITMTIVNPSSITLQNLTSRFYYRPTANAAVCTELETKIYPGGSKKVNCFISDLKDVELKSVEVSVYFEQMRFNR